MGANKERTERGEGGDPGSGEFVVRTDWQTGYRGSEGRGRDQIRLPMRTMSKVKHCH